MLKLTSLNSLSTGSYKREWNNKPYYGAELLHKLNLSYKQNMILRNKPYYGAKLLSDRSLSNHNIDNKYYGNVYVKTNKSNNIEKLSTKRDKFVDIRQDAPKLDNDKVDHVISNKYKKDGHNFYFTVGLMTAAESSSYHKVLVMMAWCIFFISFFIMHYSSLCE